MPLDPSIRESYLQHSDFTDPGSMISLYKDLPCEIPALMRLIKSQLVHPYEAKKVHLHLSRSMVREQPRIHTVRQILLGLQAKNAVGLSPLRRTKDRLALMCDQHALLFASMLRHQGYPARLRSGFAYYILPGKPVTHWLCEVWLDSLDRWVFMDPDRQVFDVPPGPSLPEGGFLLGGDAWTGARSGASHPETFHRKGFHGLGLVKNALLLDLNAVMQQELAHYRWDSSPIQDGPALYYKTIRQLNQGDTRLLHSAAELLADVDAHLDDLHQLYGRICAQTLDWEPRRKRLQPEKEPI